jgi:hypothetical protein
MINRTLLAEDALKSWNSRNQSGTVFETSKYAYIGTSRFPKSIRPRGFLPRPHDISCLNFSAISNCQTKCLGMISNHYPIHINMNSKFSSFLRQYFGSHPIYFLSNYLLGYSQDRIQNVAKLFSNISKD